MIKLKNEALRGWGVESGFLHTVLTSLIGIMQP